MKEPRFILKLNSWNPCWGTKWQLALCCSDLGIIIKKIHKAIHPFFHLLLGVWGEPSCRRHLARAFHTLLGVLRFDGLARFRGCSLNKSKSPLHTFPVLWVLFICNLFYVFSVPAFLSSQPHPHQSSSLTQFSQEWAGRKVVVNI